MENKLFITNSFTREKELFEPLHFPFVGMYVCGPTVSGESHLGHARPYVTFDLVYRYLKHLGYKVRYVRNITDAGHFEEEGRESEDKVAEKAKLERLEPMELVQKYTNIYHDMMDMLNCERPSIEPTATGHIVEQIDMIQTIISKGQAYEVNGSVYFDVSKYARENDYGKLSGRVLEDMIAGSRELEGQGEKRNPADFALWKKAAPEHIMQWNSPWGKGFPGWHIECSAMASKYLGSPFDIHGGGMDLLFPHHESEIAQTKTATGHAPAKYWMHNNMITINGRKMGKSYNNTITLREMFLGGSKVLDRKYHPMTVRFFILQTHYRSTLDFSNEALQAAEKGLQRLMNAFAAIDKIIPADVSSQSIETIAAACRDAMNDDLNTAIVVAQLFEAARIVNSAAAGSATLTAEDIKLVKKLFEEYCFDILGLKMMEEENSSSEDAEGMMQLILDLRAGAKANKDFGTADKIRDALTKLGISVKDGKEGSTWNKT
ncbi:MAG TPA: cysteine--tRNA ligase [Bacteroidia bacterium]|nr:cysteine--tRNA ligase [Bacteroidia bacterium]